MNTDKIHEACFELATNLMWQKGDLEFGEMNENLIELNTIANRLFEIAISDLDLFDNVDQRVDLIAKSIHYINSVHAIPPLKGNYDWFEYTLLTLLEIADPQSGIKFESLEFQFLTDMKKGLDDTIQHSINQNEK